MKNVLFYFICCLVLVACSSESNTKTLQPKVDWESKHYKQHLSDTLEAGSSYLSVYSSIYSLNEDQTHNLTATVSIRNTSEKDSIFLTKASYYNTKGELIRDYVDFPVVVLPMETIEIIIASKDDSGGTGANFVFDWKKNITTSAPIFEGIMISTSGSQGISFTTNGKRIL